MPNGGGNGYLQGTITNNSLIEVASEHYGTNLLLSGDVLLTGTGELLIWDNEHNAVQGASTTDRLTHSATHTIHGAYYLGFNHMLLTNHGLIDADSSLGHALIVDSTDGETSYNHATMQASGGGTLRLAPGTWDNTGGVIQALDGSTAQISGAGVSGGVLTTDGSGVIELRDGGLVADLTNTGTIQVPNGGTPGYLQGTITNNGLLEVASAGQGTDLCVHGDVTLDGSGRLTLGDNSYNHVRGAVETDRLINSTTHTINGANSLGYNLMLFTNHGLIDANRPGLTLYVDPVNTGTNYNDAIMQASDGGILRCTTGSWDNTGGVIQALDGSTVQITNGAAITGGTVTTTGSGIIEFTENARLVNLVNDGYLKIPNGGGSGYVQGTVTNNGTIEVEGDHYGTLLRIDSDTELAGTGVVLLGGHNDIHAAGFTLTNGAGHTIRSLGWHNYIYPDLTNYGTVDVPTGTADVPPGRLLTAARIAYRRGRHPHRNRYHQPGRHPDRQWHVQRLRRLDRRRRGGTGHFRRAAHHQRRLHPGERRHSAD